jgi:DNA-binding MarR family transcriptional regulator
MSDGRAILFHAAVVADLLDGLLDRQLAATRLKPREFEIATVLATRGPMSPGEIATVSGVPAPSVSRVIGQMEAAGLVSQAANPTDGRSRIVRMTSEGSAAFEGAQAAFLELLGAVQAHLGEGLPMAAAAVHRLEWALRSVAGVEVADPVEDLAATSSTLHYAGAPLRLDEEAEVLDYIDWLRHRAGREKARS